MVTGQKCSVSGCQQRGYTFRPAVGHTLWMCKQHNDVFEQGGVDRLFGGKQALDLRDLVRSLCARILQNTEEDAGGCRAWSYDDVRLAVELVQQEVE